MFLHSLFTALFLGAATPARAASRVTDTVLNDRVSPARETELVEAGKQAFDNVMARTHVERAGHFDVPRFG